MIFPRRPPLAAALARRLKAWRALPPADLRRPHAQARYVVVDVEASGLDPDRDRLIAIGACAVVGGRIEPADSFAVVLQQAQVSPHDNILLHGIGADRQRTGLPPAEALTALLEYVRHDPLLAFHAAFDRRLIERACRIHLGLRPRLSWLDLARLLPLLVHEPKLRSLDDWCAHYGIANPARHDALADAWATARLALIALRFAEARGLKHFQALQSELRAQAWLRRGL
ncbi:MAG: 3'-5' exonuclease [Thiobacillaceae bacterium]|nr:3'-5' exonuclease [Thiobacillaceae bacterium]